MEVYSSNSAGLTQNAVTQQNSVSQFNTKMPAQAGNSSIDLAKNEAPLDLTFAMAKKKLSLHSAMAKEDSGNENFKAGMATNAVQAPLPEQEAQLESAYDTQKTARSAAIVNAPAVTDKSVNTDTVTSAPATAALSGAMTASAAPAPASTTPLPASEVQAMPVPAAPVASPPPAAITGGAEMTDRFRQAFGKIQRNVVPQQMLVRDTASLSNTVPEESDFRRVIGSETSGALARFLENRMRLMVWSHPTVDATIVFGAQLDQAKLVETFQLSFQIPEMARGQQQLLALKRQ